MSSSMLQNATIKKHTMRCLLSGAAAARRFVGSVAASTVSRSGTEPGYEALPHSLTGQLLLYTLLPPTLQLAMLQRAFYLYQNLSVC